MKRILFLLIYFLSPLPLIYILYQTNPSRYQDLTSLLAMVLGVLGYSWFIWQFVLSARPRFLDRLLGLSRVYRLHGIMGIVSIGLALTHKIVQENRFKESFMTSLGDVSLNLFIFISILSIFFMTNSIISNIPNLERVKQFLMKIKVFGYNYLRLLHNGTFIGLLFMQYHVLQTSNAKANIRVFQGYMIYFLIALNFYFYHKILKYWILKTATYRVQKIVRLSPSMWNIIIQQKKGRKLTYQPGQFGFFRFLSDRISDEEHPFSISSVDKGDGSLSITIKELGDFTSKIGEIEQGTQVVVDAPYGSLSYMKHRKERDLVFIAGGVGITPMISMMTSLYESDFSGNITLVWGMKNQEDFIFKEEWEQYRQKMPNLKIIPVMSREPDYQGEKGYINYTLLEKVFNEEEVNKATGFYLCGPNKMMDLVIQSLTELGIAKKRIHHEKFSL
ncbi:MAG: hypothetical protein JW708_05525 [Vallitaleaceae bacterium]|nr:hypothetical protein [Vallitaleaceae bacterium]